MGRRALNLRLALCKQTIQHRRVLNVGGLVWYPRLGLVCGTELTISAHGIFLTMN